MVFGIFMCLFSLFLVSHTQAQMAAGSFETAEINKAVWGRSLGSVCSYKEHDRMLMSTSRTARCDTAEAEVWNATSSPPPVTGLMSDVLQLIAPQVKTSPGKRNLRFTESPNLQSRVPLSSGENWAGSKVADSCLACYLNCSCGCGLCRDLGSVTAIFKNACIINEPVNASATIKNNFCVAIFEGTTHVFMGPSVNFCVFGQD